MIRVSHKVDMKIVFGFHQLECQWMYRDLQDRVEQLERTEPNVSVNVQTKKPSDSEADLIWLLSFDFNFKVFFVICEC
jgi:hypothetical protein